MLNNVFGLPIYKSKVKKHAATKPVVMEEVKKLMADPRCLTQRDNERVYSDYRLGNDPATRRYRDCVIDAVKPNINEFAQSMGARSVQMGGIWFQHYERFSFHNTHTHWPSLFSVVYYVQFDPKEHEPTAFLNPMRLQVQMYEMRGLRAPSEFKPEVTEGTLIVFPGYLDHFVPLCQSDKPRTIVSFNFDLDG